MKTATDSMVCERGAKNGPNKGKGARGTVGGYKRHLRASEDPCEECLEAYRQWYREWAKGNSEKLREQGRRYERANTGKRREKSRRWREANPDHVKKYGRAYRQANVEALKIRQRAYRQANAERIKERDKTRSRAYRRTNVEVVREQERRRRAREAAAPTIPYTAAQLEQRMSMFGGRCWLRIHCDGAPMEQIEHVIALSLGGWHCLSNLRPSCHSCNSAKGNKDWKAFVR